jgi:hypothetical protein
VSAPVSDAPLRIRKKLSEVLAGQLRFCKEHPQVGVKYEGLAEPNVKLVLPVYTAGAPSEARSHLSPSRHCTSMMKPKQVAWRFFLETKQGVNVATELPVGKHRESYHQLQCGDFVRHIFEASKTLRRKKRLQGRTYSLRLFQVPSLYFSAFWLKCNRYPDLFVPLVDLPRGPKSGRVYTRSEVARALVKQLVKKREAREELNARKSKSKVEKDAK